jgi:hypothetical protein
MAPPPPLRAAAMDMGFCRVFGWVLKADVEANMSWNDERVELLKKLWTDGLSASQIAGELGGVTRNAVIGKVHRLGLSGRAKAPSVSAPRVRKAVPRAPARPVSMPQMRGNTALAAMPMTETYIVAEMRPMAEVVVPIGFCLLRRRLQLRHTVLHTPFSHCLSARCRAPPGSLNASLL